LLDLLTPVEAADRTNVFDVDLLASRVAAAIDWLYAWWAGHSPRRAREPATGLFGASTGAAAALQVAADRRRRVRAVVSRGGRPDLAAEYLDRVNVPALLIVGSRDETVLELNQRALQHLVNGSLSVVPGAGHLFEEPGTLDMAAQLARDWFRSRLH
jgi:pimeloyl-ACP methyl ester carboxylesterase